LGGRVRRLDRLGERIANWFEFFGLVEGGTTLRKDPPKGTPQKLMRAAAFIHEPALVFLDEPFINLDPIYQRRLKEFLTEYIAGGGTAFMASHLLDIAAKLCHRVAVIRSGSIIATGTVDQIPAHDAALQCAFIRLAG